MTLYLIIATGVFLLLCESLFYWRVQLIKSHRALARSLIIGNTSLDFWEDIELFNSFGTWEEHFWNWKRWRFESFYKGVLQDEHSHFLGV